MFTLSVWALTSSLPAGRLISAGSDNNKLPPKGGVGGLDSEPAGARRAVVKLLNRYKRQHLNLPQTSSSGAPEGFGVGWGGLGMLALLVRLCPLMRSD